MRARLLASPTCRSTPWPKSKRRSKSLEMTANAPSWLIANPIAPRGLHDAGRGVNENPRGAADAAAAHGNAIECDVQLSADGEAIVFHDEALDRLTLSNGLLAHKTAAEI